MTSSKKISEEAFKDRGLYTFSRYFAAFMLIMYGFAKINGSQFTVVDWVQDEPLNQVPGFWLVWYYMSYSKAYGTIVALTQILGGILLMFRRTTLLATIVLLFIMSNIVLINFFFQIPQSALIAALLITASLLVIVIHHHHELLNVFWKQQNAIFPGKSNESGIKLTKWIIRGLVVFLPIIFTYWIANYNNRVPTPIDGVWEVVEIEGELSSKTKLHKIYFEKERGYMAVFRYEDGKVSQKHFEVDTTKNKIEMWDHWMQKNNKYLSGSYKLAEPHKLLLEGKITENDSTNFNIKLEKIR